MYSRGGPGPHESYASSHGALCACEVRVVMHVCVRWPENRMLVGGWMRSGEQV